MKVIIVKIINIDATAQDAGTVNVLSNGTPLNVSISIGKVIQSEFLVTTHDAPNSPNDIATVKIPAINIEFFIIGSFIFTNLSILDRPKTLRIRRIQR